MKISFAPIIITTLNRYQHFRLCVESISQSSGAAKTDLFIAIDYPAQKSHEDGYERICEYSKTINGFKSIKIIHRERNFGAELNLKSVKELIYSTYDRFIYVEDDCELSKNFLDYINKGLEKFRDDPRIIAVCGDGGIFEKPGDYNANYLYRKGFSAWGYGTWFDRDYKVDYSVADMREFVADPKLRKLLKYYYERHYYSTLSNIYRVATMRGDGAIALDMIKNDTYCVYPTVSKVRNHGHDGSGEHGGKLRDNPYNKVVIDDSEHFEFQGDPVFDDSRYLSILRNRTRFTPKQKLKFWLRASQNPKKMLDLWKLVH